MRSSLAARAAGPAASAAPTARLAGQPLGAQLLRERQIPARLDLARQGRAHGEEAGRSRDVVHAEDVRTRTDPVRERRQRARETLTRAAPGERTDEVLARDRQQQRP